MYTKVEVCVDTRVELMTMEYVNIGMMYENSQQKSATIEWIRKSQKQKTLLDAVMFPGCGKLMEITTNSQKHFWDSKDQKNENTVIP